MEFKKREFYKKIMKTKIISFILGSLFTIAAFYIFANFLPSTQQEAAHITSEAVNPIKEPTLSLPLSYFRREDLRSSTGEKTQLDGGYRSHPATTITFIDFRNTDEALPDMPDEEKWTILTDEMTMFSSLYAAQHQAYGEIGKRYAGKMQDIYITEADVTNDGIPEKILGVSDVGVNHLPHLYQIVQNERIIFEAGVSTTLLGDLDPHLTQNGFILKWAGEKHLEGRGLCCPLGYTATRFVFDDGEFVPVYEQDNRYFQVENSDE